MTEQAQQAALNQLWHDLSPMLQPQPQVEVAVGWWVLLVLGFFMVLLSLILLWHRYRRARHQLPMKKAALDELQQYFQQLPAEATQLQDNPMSFWFRFTKRWVRQAYPQLYDQQPQWTQLTPKQWLSLCRQLPVPLNLSDTQQALLTEHLYQPLPHFIQWCLHQPDALDVDAKSALFAPLHQQLLTWVRSHRPHQGLSQVDLSQLRVVAND